MGGGPSVKYGGVINQLWGGHQPTMGGGISQVWGGLSTNYGGGISQLWGGHQPSMGGGHIFPPVCTGSQNPQNYFSNTDVLPSVNRTAGPTNSPTAQLSLFVLYNCSRRLLTSYWFLFARYLKHTALQGIT